MQSVAAIAGSVRRCRFYCVMIKKGEPVVYRFRFLRLRPLLSHPLAACLAFLPAGLSAQGDAEETYSAFAVQATAGAPTTRLSITIRGWTTDAERKALLEALTSGGQQELARELGKQASKGVLFFMGGDSTRPQYELRYVREFPNENGREIVLGFDRYISMAEARRGPTTSDWNLSYVVLKLDESGNGEGQLVMGAKLRFTGEKLEVESVAERPLRLLKVKREK